MASLVEALRGAVSQEQLNQLVQALNLVSYDAGIETVTSGALSLTKRTSLISIDATKAYTLADGTYVGQLKDISVIAAANTPDGTLTPATMVGGTSIDLDAVNESATLQWNGTAWRVIKLTGATINA